MPPRSVSLAEIGFWPIPAASTLLGDAHQSFVCPVNAALRPVGELIFGTKIRIRDRALSASMLGFT
jgi:hypothetical protein